MDRRRMIGSIGAAGLAVLAGCSGSSSGPAPDENADTEELLPGPPEGWEITEKDEQLAIQGMQGGYAASYNAPGDVGGDVVNADYRVWILRWDSNSNAKEFQGEVAEKAVYVVQNNFCFYGDGPNLDNLIMLLSDSPTLTEEYIRENNLNK